MAALDRDGTARAEAAAPQVASDAAEPGDPAYAGAGPALDAETG